MVNVKYKMYIFPFFPRYLKATHAQAATYMPATYSYDYHCFT